MLSMNAPAPKSKPARTIDQQIKEAKKVLRELQETLEDLQDIQALRRAKKRNGGKPGTPWEIVAKELGIKPPRKRHS
jgi:hypothetical protein